MGTYFLLSKSPIPITSSTCHSHHPDMLCQWQAITLQGGLQLSVCNLLTNSGSTFSNGIYTTIYLNWCRTIWFYFQEMRCLFDHIYIYIYIYIKLCKQRSAFGRGALSSGWNTQFVGRKACSSIGLSCNVAVPVQFMLCDLLNHQGRLTHIWVNKLTLIGSDNGLSPGRHQAITWNSAELFSIGPLGTIFEWFWSPKKTLTVTKNTITSAVITQAYRPRRMSPYMIWNYASQNTAQTVY